jgi:hypothetical protein
MCICVAALVLSEQCHSRRCLPLLIVLSPFPPPLVPGAVHRATSSRNKGEPSLFIVHRHELAPRLSATALRRMAYGAMEVMEYASTHLSSDSSNSSSPLSRHRMWRDVTKTASRAPCHTRPCHAASISPHHRPSSPSSPPVRPIRFVLSSFVRGGFPITSSSYPALAKKFRTTGRGSVPLRRSVLSVSDRFRSSAAVSDDSDERAGRRARFWA